MWALVKVNQNNPESKIQKLDISICDENGNVCVEMKGFSTRKYEKENVEKSQINKNIGTVILKPEWLREEITKSNYQYQYNKHIVILCELPKQIAEDIQKQMRSITCIELNAKKDKNIDIRFKLYTTLVFKQIQKVLKEKGEETLIQIIIPSYREQQIFAGLSGLLKTAHLENPKLRGQVILVDKDTSSKDIVDIISINKQSLQDKIIFYKNDERYIHKWKEESINSRVTMPWKNEGVYLITGGMGGLGFIFAKEIAKNSKNSTIILTGRSPIDEKIRTKITGINKQIQYRELDVANKTAVNTLIKEIIKDFGKLSGIIHSAGIIRDNFIIKKTTEEVEKVLAPKTSGIVHLDEASKDIKLDFFISFSSIAGIMGNSGQVDYAAANAFMDYYCLYRNRLVEKRKRYGQSTSINWSFWKDGGMQVDESVIKMMRKHVGMIPLSTSDGINSFYQAFACNKNQILVCYDDKDKIISSISDQIAKIEDTSESGSVKEIKADILEEKVITYLKMLLSSVIKLSPQKMGTSISMEKYGIDSLMVLELTEKLETAFGSLPKTLFFEYESLDKLAKYFIKNHRTQLFSLLNIQKKYETTITVEEKNLNVNKNHTKKRSRFTSLQIIQEKHNTDIAIIGLAGRYPQANNLHEFWENLKVGKDSITEIPKERWDYSLYYDSDKSKTGKTYNKWGGFIENVDKFDPLLFKISPRDAEIMDPQERLSEKIRKLKETLNINFSSFFLAAFKIFLCRYTGEHDIAVGVPTAGRWKKQYQETIGYFIGMIVVRNRVNSSSSFALLSKQIQKAMIEALDHMYPFQKLVQELNIKTTQNVSPIFQIYYAYQNFVRNNNNFDYSNIELLDVVQQQGEYEFGLEIFENKDNFTLYFKFNPSVYAKKSVEKLVDHYIYLIEEICQRNDFPIHNYKILPKEERTRILYQWNDTKNKSISKKCIHQRFEEQAEKTPDEIAIVCKNEKITYRELNEKANQLAYYLIENGVQQETAVGIYLDRSIWMIVSMFAIFKVGGCYVALDKNYPKERTNYIIKDAEIKIAIADEDNLTIPKLLLVNDNKYKKYDKTNINKEISDNCRAYILYTSGSTGQPKGVQIEHSSVISLIDWSNKIYSEEERKNVLAATSICFDLSIFEIFCTLCLGGKITLVQNILDISDNSNLTLINTVPSAIKNLMEHNKIPQTAKTINLAGEPLDKNLVDSLYKIPTIKKVYDLYGPSEDTTYSTCCLRKQGGIVSIGRGIENTQLYILNDYLNPLPVGVIGEIYIAGSGLARGYIKKPHLTAEKFVPNPFSKDGGERLYKTGDLARYTEDGNIEFIGRKDYQVKVRGFRIELGEIEKNLTKHPKVKEVAVLVKGSVVENKIIVAYIVTEKNVVLEEIQSYLEKKIPTYMIPSQYIVLEKLPLTLNGKVDRKALQKLDIRQNKKKETLTELEQLILNIWQKLIPQQNINTTDNFFHIGGHSLLATQLASRLTRALNKEINVHNVFFHPTIQKMSRYVQQLDKEKTLFEIKKTKRTKYMPVSFAQQRLCFLHKLEDTSENYNIPMAFQLIGELDIKLLENAFHFIVERHESLRTNFTEAKNDFFQLISDARFVLEIKKDYKMEEILGQIEQEAYYCFDLERDSLLRTTIYTLNNKEHILFINIHHAISDDWSLQIMMKELAIVYNALKQNKSSNNLLLKLEIDYVDYAIWQRESVEKKEWNKQFSYWCSQLKDIPSILDIQTDKPRPAIQTYNGDYIKFEIDDRVTTKLKQVCIEEGVTLFMYIYSVFSYVLAKYSNQKDIIVGTPIAGRNHEKIENLLGCFINILPLRTKIDAHLTFLQLLQQVRDTTLSAYDNQDIPFEYLVSKLVKIRDMSRSPIFQAMLSWQNLDSHDFNFDGVQIEMLEFPYKIAKYDITLTMQNTDNKLLGYLEYNTDLFVEETMQRFVTCFKNILLESLENLDKELHTLEILSKKEKDKILYKWNDTKHSFPQNKLIHQLFEEQAKKRPQQIAVVYENQKYTYEALNQESNKMANCISQFHLSDSKIGVLLPRSEKIIISLLAILKTNNVYIPIDPKYPKKRIEAIIADARIETVITDKNNSYLLPDFVKPILFSDKNTCREAPLNIKINYDKIVYIVYTSGTTGQPKGVLIKNTSLLNNIFSYEYFYKSGDQRELMMTSFSFDVSIRQIFTNLVFGSTIYIATEEIINDPEFFSDYVQNNQITMLDITPSYCQVLLENMNREKYSSLKYLILGSEVLDWDLVEKLWTKKIDVALFNLYGPTECCIDSHIYKINQKTNTTTVPIGQTKNNMQTYILDEFLSPVPIGVVGQIYITGIGLAKGYVNNEELTEKKFIANPYVAESKMYVTGDLGRWLPDGNIEFMGRADNQVKIHGFRIELAEIEFHLKKQKNIQDAIVTVKENSSQEKELIAYVISKNEKIKTKEVISRLKKVLPNYMIPHHVICLDKFPLTSNGKIDYKTLSKKEFVVENRKNKKPSNKMEEELLKIWQEVLKKQEISIDSNFFELGGHSLLAIQLASKIKQRFGQMIDLATIFKSPTIENIGQILLNKEEKDNIYLHKIKESGKNIPLFLVPGIEGHPFIFNKLTDSLNPEQPLYSFQLPGLYNECSPLETIQQIGKLYEDLLIQNLCGKPCILGGYSFGCSVAFEMALRLQEKKCPVKGLILIDGALNKIDLSMTEKQQYQEQFQEYIKSFVGTMDKDTLKSYLELLQLNEKAVQNYIPNTKLTIPIFYLRTQNQYNFVEQFQEYSKVKIEIFDLPGDHFSIFDSPNLELLVEYLNEIMEILIKYLNLEF